MLAQSDRLTRRESGTFCDVVRSGRSGRLAGGTKDFIEIRGHTLNEKCGTLEFWFCPLDDLTTWTAGYDLPGAEPDFGFYPLLSSSETPRKRGTGKFALSWDSGWYPNLIAQFFEGHLYSDSSAGKAYVLAGHCSFRRDQWYCIHVTWNDPEQDYRLYLNGILVSTSNRFVKEAAHEACEEVLRAGNPSLVIGDIDFLGTERSSAEIASAYRAAAEPTLNPQLQDGLASMYGGRNLKELEWAVPSDWETVFEKTLTDANALEAFYVQGMESAPKVTRDGLLVETAMDRRKGNFGALTSEDPTKRIEDKDQVYLWTWEQFEGRHLAVELEFMPLNHNGLALLVLQASGMQGEDFLREYPLRTNGWMKTVYGENVRNYHWEFFREMDDCRNDVASHVLAKNPWGWPLQYQCAPGPLELNRWHKLLFLQREDRLLGAIDGTVVLDVRDDPTIGHGPLYRNGHLGIRCMWKTKMLFRNLKVSTRGPAPGEPTVTRPD